MSASDHVAHTLWQVADLFVVCSFSRLCPKHLHSTRPPMLPTNTVVDHQLGQSQGLDQDIPIDPALFDIEQIVYDARKNKERLMGEEETRRAVDHLPVQMAEAEEEVMNDHGDDNGAGDGLGLLDEEFDPALREIVNSLTNAQQVCHHVSTGG